MPCDPNEKKNVSKDWKKCGVKFQGLEKSGSEFPNLGKTLVKDNSPGSETSMTERRKQSRRRTLLAAARDAVGDVQRRLPADLAREVDKLTVSFEDVPDDDLVSAGFEPETLALFEGETFAEEGQTSFPVPPRIRLFLDNLWDEAGGDLDRFRREVRTSYLHELGHYLGLDEQDLEARGLE